MSRLAPALLFFALSAASALSQVNPNAVTLELGGPGGAYSVGYERAVAPFVHVQLAVAYYGFSTVVPASVVWTPDLVSHLRAEVGAGVVVGRSDSPSLYAGGDAFEDGVNTTKVLPTVTLGARLPLGRVDLRAGVTALYGVRSLAQTPERETFLFPRIGAAIRF